MIEEKSVDTEGFSEIFGKMRRKIAEIYPEWNDYNYHDPGITLLELFAFLNENQNYYMNRTSDKIYRNFLRLAFELPEKVKPATLKIDLNDDIEICTNDKFYADGICFESENGVSLVANNVLKYTVSNIEYMDGNFYPFGDIPVAENEFILHLRNELVKGKKCTLSVNMRDSFKRNPIYGNFLPLAKLKIFYGDKELSFVDNTYCFLQSGEISFDVPLDANIYDKPMIKFKLVECEYDVAPYIYNVTFSQVTLCQIDTKISFCHDSELADMNIENKYIDYYYLDDEYFVKGEETGFCCIYDEEFYQNRLLAVGNGFPNQSYKIDSTSYIYDVNLFVESPIHKGKYEFYEFVDDFDASSPISRHFKIEKNEIIFGNGINGRCPEGDIIIVSLVFTNGAEGNISGGNIIEYNGSKYKMQNESYGGANPKSIDEMFEKSIEEIPTRLVTASDFEQAIKKTSGLIIDDCKALENDANDIVSVVVKPSGQRAVLSQKYRENIKRFLEPRRLLGSEIKIYSPIYTEIEIFIDVVRSPLYLNAKKAVENELEKYFKSLKTFGAVTEYSVLYQKIDALEEIVKINSFNISAKGDGIARNRKGDVITLQNSVTILKETEILVNDML